MNPTTSTKSKLWLSSYNLSRYWISLFQTLAQKSWIKIFVSGHVQFYTSTSSTPPPAEPLVSLHTVGVAAHGEPGRVCLQEYQHHSPVVKQCYIIHDRFLFNESLNSNVLVFHKYFNALHCLELWACTLTIKKTFWSSQALEYKHKKYPHMLLRQI